MMLNDWPIDFVNKNSLIYLFLIINKLFYDYKKK